MTGFGLMLNRIKWFWNIFPESLLTQTSDWLPKQNNVGLTVVPFQTQSTHNRTRWV